MLIAFERLKKYSPLFSMVILASTILAVYNVNEIFMIPHWKEINKVLSCAGIALIVSLAGGVMHFAWSKHMKCQDEFESAGYAWELIALYSTIDYIRFSYMPENIWVLFGFTLPFAAVIAYLMPKDESKTIHMRVSYALGFSLTMLYAASIATFIIHHA